MRLALREAKESKQCLAKLRLSSLAGVENAAGLEQEADQLAAIFATIVLNVRRRLERAARHPSEPKRPAFPGFPDFRANVTFVPIQYFTVVVPHCSRGCVRIVGYMIRKILGWVDEQGNPTQETLRFSYRQLIEDAGVSREAIADALAEAIDKRFIRCLQQPQPDRGGHPGQSGIYELCWDEYGPYTDSPEDFRGFYFPEAAEMPVREKDGVVRRPKLARKNIPNAFFDYLLRHERLRRPSRGRPAVLQHQVGARR